MKTISAITTFKTPATGMANNIPRGPINVPPINRTALLPLDEDQHFHQQQVV